MSCSNIGRPSGRLVTAIVWLWLAACGNVLSAGKITLHDGTILEGVVEPEGLLVHIDDGLHRFTFSSKQIQTVNQAGDDNLSLVKPFRIRQRLSGRNTSKMIDNLVAITKISGFDSSGVRKVTVIDPKRGRVELPQGIVEIGTDHVQLQCLSYLWDSRVATRSIPPSTIVGVIRQSIKSDHVDDRFRLARFMIATGWYTLAEAELNAIAEEFPAVQTQVKEAVKVLNQLKARRRVDEIKLRRRSGQHSLAYQLLQKFELAGAPGDVVSDVRDMLKGYEQILQKMMMLQKEITTRIKALDDSELSAAASAAGSEIARGVHVENLYRFQPFLDSLAEKTTAAEALALVISGWVAGPAFAVSDLDQAVRYWEAKDLVAEYLNAGIGERPGLLKEIRSRENVDAELVGGILEQLAPHKPTAGLQAGRAIRLEVAGFHYWVQLPWEYNIYRRFPVIITLHGRHTTPEKQISWWSSKPGFQAARHGYIVLAPEYVDDPGKGYRYDARTHEAVLYSLVDLRRRFSVDSDRVFLSGHSMGGHAAWDIGLAHPGLFAGVIPIAGSPQFFCEHYWPNGRNASFYVVDGEKNGESPEQNRRVMDRMMMNGYDSLFVEFKGRGQENFSDEILKIFEWMARKKRNKYPLEFECRSARPTDNEFYWLSVNEYIPAVLMDPRVYDRKRIRTARVGGKLNSITNAVQVNLQGATDVDLWLSPSMLDLSRPVRVVVNGSTKHNKPVALDMEVLLEDFRARSDQQNLYFARLSFPRT